ncbi:MAG: DNA polymerase III subunit delta [Deltaproteobacteria bacterium]|jgi:DNA polymerase-3 subunit delta|nr:DNA polymerase III subunit delta [Deltaproteobacteria bacterium]
MEVSQFIEEVGGPARRPFYLAVGADPQAQNKVIQAARSVVNPDFFDFNFQSFKTDDVDWGQILESASTGPFFLPPRVVIIKREKYLPAELDRLARYLEKPHPDNIVVLIAENPGEKQKFFKDQADLGLEVNCRAPQKSELPGWLVKQATALGCQLTLDGARSMVERIGENLYLLLGELEKLSIYPGPGTPITAREIRALVSLTPTAAIYELGDPLANQNVPAAIQALLDLEENSSSFSLLYTVGNHFLRLVKFKISLETANPESLSGPAPLGYKPYYFNNLRSQVSKWPWARLAEALTAIHQAHRTMITVSTSQSAILEELSLSLATCLTKASQGPSA